jgi:hypothetical protein
MVGVPATASSGDNIVVLVDRFLIVDRMQIDVLERHHVGASRHVWPDGIDKVLAWIVSHALGQHRVASRQGNGMPARITEKCRVLPMPISAPRKVM